jgi:hypothetical protein
MNVLQMIGASLEKCSLSKDNVILKGSKIFKVEKLVSEGIAEYGFSETEIRKEIDNWVEKQKRKRAEKLETSLSHCPEVVLAEILAKAEISYNFSRDEYLQSGEKIKRPVVDNTIISLCDDIQKKYDDRPYSWKTLLATLDLQEDRLEREERKNISKKLAYDPAYVGYADKILDEIIDLWNIKGDKEIIKAGIKHWCWNVKRRMNDLECRWGLMLYFYSEWGGAGKTYFANALVESISERFVALSVSSKQLCDIERESNKLENNYAMVIDEMKPLDEESLMSLRATIECKSRQIRVLGVQRQNRQLIRAQMIATANYDISRIIHDDSGYRRFLQLEFGLKDGEITENLKTKQNALILKLSRLWKGIDEKNESGYVIPGTALYNRIRSEQKGYAKHDSLDEWVKSKGWDYIETETSDVIWMKLSEIRSEYNLWCKQQGYRFQINPGKIGGLLAKRTLSKHPHNIFEFAFKPVMDNAEEQNINLAIEELEMEVF